MRAYIQTASSLSLCLFLAWAASAEERPASSLNTRPPIPAEESIGTMNVDAPQSKDLEPSDSNTPDKAGTPAKDTSNQKSFKREAPKAEDGPGAGSREDSPPPDRKNLNKTEAGPESKVTSPPETSEKKKTGVQPDRRWIIKQKPPETKKVGKKKPKPISWESKDQKALCETYREELRKDFLNARYYSIQGDSCSTARYAKAFLESCETFRKECPRGLLERYGYREDHLRNLELLYELGTKRCKGKEMAIPARK